MLESVWQEHIRSPHGWSALHNHLPPASALSVSVPTIKACHHGDKGVPTPHGQNLFVTMVAKEARGQ